MLKLLMSTLILITVTISLGISQPCNQLAQIIETGVQNSGGLGQDFTGEKGPDGILYF